MTSSNSKNIWNIVVPVMVILLIVFIVSISYLFLSHTDNPSGITLIEINQSIIPKGTIYHLSEKDFNEFPALEQVIRYNSPKPIEYNGRKYYTFKLSQDERIKFIRNYPVSVNQTTVESESYFEYNGKFYSISPPPIS
jgi:hypothetical protein